MNEDLQQYISRVQYRIAAELDSLPGQVRAGVLTQDGADARQNDLLAERRAVQRLIDEVAQ